MLTSAVHAYCNGFAPRDRVEGICQPTRLLCSSRTRPLCRVSGPRASATGSLACAAALLTRTAATAGVWVPFCPARDPALEALCALTLRSPHHCQLLDLLVPLHCVRQNERERGDSHWRPWCAYPGVGRCQYLLVVPCSRSPDLHSLRSLRTHFGRVHTFCCMSKPKGTVPGSRLAHKGHCAQLAAQLDSSLRPARDALHPPAPRSQPPLTHWWWLYNDRQRHLPRRLLRRHVWPPQPRNCAERHAPRHEDRGQLVLRYLGGVLLLPLRPLPSVSRGRSQEG